jgi:hypothetical protein
MSYAGEKRHRNAIGITRALPGRRFPEAPDGEDHGAVSEDDEESARERIIREGILNGINDGSDSEGGDVLEGLSSSTTSTPPLSQLGDDEQEEQGARVDGGYIGADADMDPRLGLLASGLEPNDVKFDMFNWVQGACTALLSPFRLGLVRDPVWCCATSYLYVLPHS